jgi:hypothetical protein
VSPTLRPRRAARRDAARRAAALGAGAAAAAAGFGVLAAASARRTTAPTDEKVRARAAEAGRRPGLRAALTGPGHVGKWWAYLPAALGASAFLLRRRGGGRGRGPAPAP